MPHINKELWYVNSEDRYICGNVPTAEVTDCEIILRDTRNPYGRVDAGCSLTIRSHLIELNISSTIGSEELALSPWAKGGDVPYKLDKRETRYCSDEYRIHQRTAWCIFDFPDARPHAVLLGVILAYRSVVSVMPGETAPTYNRCEGVVGILAAPRAGDGYTLVGVFDIWTGNREGTEEIMKGIPPQTLVLY